MKKTPLTEMSTNELVKQKRLTSIVTGFLAGMLIILLAQSIYKWTTDGFPSAIAIPIALSPIVFVNLKKIKEIKRELEIRGKDFVK